MTIAGASEGGTGSSLPARHTGPRQPAATSLMAPDRSVRDGIFTAAQAKRGAAVYLRECSACHGDGLGGGEGSPALTGPEFTSKWDGRTAGDLLDTIRSTMPPPPDRPGRLTNEQYADVLAYVLSVHKLPAGQVELAAGTEPLKRIRLDLVRKP
jgi:mono/diheme cytochrome c family protein